MRDKIRDLKKEDVPQATDAAGVSMTLGELRAAVARFPLATSPSVSCSDDGGFESCLSLFWLIYARGIVWLTTQTDCKPYVLKFDGERPQTREEWRARRDEGTVWRPDVINFRQHQITIRYDINRLTVREIMRVLETLPEATPVYLAARKNISPVGEHWILPLNSVGPSVWVNGKDEYSIETDVLSLGSSL